MDSYLKANRRHWDEVVPIHERSEYYDLAAFKAGKTSLHTLEMDELGDVSGKTMLHLQCHFGMDTLSLARLGAYVTGVDFSPNAISAARRLAADTGIEARFIESDVYSLPDKLDARFDIVFTSYGVLSWLPDIRRWAGVLAHFLRPGGVFYIVEFHPVSGIFYNGPEVTDFQVLNPYFPTIAPLRFDDDGSYADREAVLENKTTYSWPHPLSEIVNSLIAAGLRLEYLHEFPYTIERWFAFMERGADGYFRLDRFDRSVPLLFSIRASR